MCLSEFKIRKKKIYYKFGVYVEDKIKCKSNIVIGCLYIVCF